MRFYKHPLVIAVVFVGLTVIGLGIAIVRHQWLFSCELTQGIRVVQTPFKHSYDIHTFKGQVIENVFGWIIRPGYMYGAYAQESYFMIDLQFQPVAHFSSLGELNMILREKKLSRYNMNDEENISHLIYNGGRNRKYR